MITYDVPDALGVETVSLSQLPVGWERQETDTQRLGDEWHGTGQYPLLSVPSAVVPLADSPDVNFLINHNHLDSARITIRSRARFAFDARLL